MASARKKIEDRINTWEQRRKEWPPKILMIGISGFVGSVLSAISQMEHEINFSNIKLGTYLVMSGWVIGTPASWGVIIFILNHLKRKNARKLINHVTPSEPGKEGKTVSEPEGNDSNQDKMTAVWLIILTIVMCSGIPALMIWLTTMPK